MNKKTKKEENLNVGEQLEIKEDVKDALGKALKDKKTSIDKTLKEGSNNILNQEEVDQILIKPKNSDKKPIIITIILTFLIAVVGIFMYFSNNPKTIFIKSIDKTFNTLEKNIIPKYQKTKGTFTLNINNNESIKVLTNYDIDSKEDLFKADTKIELNNSEFLKTKLYKENNKTYIYLENIYDQFIKIENNTPTKEETKTILNSLNKAINKGIEKEKIIGSTTKINIDNQNIKTYKSTLTLNKQNYDTVLDTIGQELKNDKKFIKALTNITNENNIEQTITEKINQKKNNFKNSDSISINIYTKGATQKFVKLEIIKNQVNKTTNISITSNTNNQYSYSIQNPNIQLKGSIDYNKEKNNLNLKVTMNETKITLNNNYKKVDKINKQDITNNIDIKKLAESIKNTINDKNNKILEIVKNK